MTEKEIINAIVLARAATKPTNEDCIMLPSDGTEGKSTSTYFEDTNQDVKLFRVAKTLVLDLANEALKWRRISEIQAVAIKKIGDTSEQMFIDIREILNNGDDNYIEDLVNKMIKQEEMLKM